MPGKVAFVFPGQGSQYVGMGLALARESPVVAEALQEADAALGEPLSRLAFMGPEEELRQTRNTQPAILAVSVSIHRLLAPVIGACCVAGHSLGEYSALVAAGSLSLSDAVRTVRERGRLMEEAVAPGTGIMAAILGLSARQVQQLCSEAGELGVVEPASFNGGGQVVIAGAKDAVEDVARRAMAMGARRVQPLNVAGPFHSSLLIPAGARLRQVLSEVSLLPARIPVYCNTLAAPCQDAGMLREALVDQVSQAVRWEESVLAMWAAGVSTFVEIGPGRVLSGLIRRIAKDATILNVEDPQSWGKFLAWAKGNGVI